MSNFTFFLYRVRKIFLSIFLALLFAFPLFSNNENSLLALQCPADVYVGPVPGECGFFLDFNSLVWSSSEPLLDTLFSPGPGYFFPPGTTEVTLTVTDTFGNIEVCYFNVILEPPTTNLICDEGVVIDFNGECTRELGPFEILIGGPYGCEDFYDVRISKDFGADLGNILDTGFVDQTFTVRITDNLSGYFCWGSIIVQSSEMPQTITCPPSATVFCHEPLDSVGFPVVDGCFAPEDYSHTYIDETENSFCDGDDIAFSVLRKWTSSDPAGFPSQCDQLITAKRIKFNDIDFPINFDGISNPALPCSDVVDLSIATDVSITGIPTVNGLDPTGLACNFSFSYTDSIDNICGNHFIVKRKWQAFDYCLNEFFHHIQTIIVADNMGPQFSVPDTILFSNDNNCSGTVLLPPINLINECSGYEIMVQTPSMTFHSDSIYVSFPSVPGFYEAIYTATDVCGNINSETTVVQVTENLLARCLDDIEVTADFYKDNLQFDLVVGNNSVLDIFGQPDFFANCVYDTIREVELDVDVCSEGEIIRTHTVNLNSETISCTQKIKVNHVSDFVVQFPQHFNGDIGHLPIFECGTEIPDFGEPEIFYGTCELTAVTYEDVVFTDVDSACYTILRKWSVINWCVAGDELDEEVQENSEMELNNPGCLPFPLCDLDSDGDCDNRTFRDSWVDCILPGADEAVQNTNPDSDPDSDPWDGYVYYEQIISVRDSIDPVFVNGCDMPNICILGNTCSTDVLLTFPEIDDCDPNVDISVSIRIGSIWRNGVGPHFDLEADDYLIRYVVRDNCNNQISCETTINVLDCKKPTPFCKNGVIVELNQPIPSGLNPKVSISASSLNNASFDNCPGLLKYTFSPDINDGVQHFTCSDVGPNQVQMWITDPAGNQDFCETIITIEDPGDDCQINPEIFYGFIGTEENLAVANVAVHNSIADSIFSDMSGNYLFDNSPPTVPFYVSPEKDADHTNGVTTFDVVLLTRHILGVDLLDSPYKIIAADANRSNTVTTFDAVEMRKLILGINTVFPSNTSWRFIPEDYIFDDTDNPFFPLLPDTFWINNISEISMNFIAMKIGDLNGSVSFNTNDPMTDRTIGKRVNLEIPDVSFDKNEIIEVPFYIFQKNIIGFQCAIEFNMAHLNLLEIKNGTLTNKNFGKNEINNGRINISYNQEKPIVANEKPALFTLKFITKSGGHIYDYLELNKDILNAEAYSEDLKINELDLYFQKKIPQFNEAIVFSNIPNPFNDLTYLPFYLPAEGEARFIFFAPDGKILKRVNAHFQKGYSELEISANEFNRNGIIFYQFESDYGAVRGKMILLK